MIPLDKVKQIISTYETLEKELASGNIDKKNFVKKSKEYSSVGEVVAQARDYLGFKKEKEELKKIIEDKKSGNDMIELAKNELLQLSKKNEEDEKKLKIYLLPKDEADSKNAILEIRAGTGGLEASLFVADLYKMYEKVCLNKNWSLEIINLSKSEAGGFKEVILLVRGVNIYSFLKFESGVHRVQRVPATETQGRVHTSAATVAVLPEAEEVDVKINEKDLRIDVFRSSGPGGQSVNTTDSAVRITHLPTGIVVSQQDEKSQHKNRAKAIKILRSRIYEAEREKKDRERSRDRKKQIGSGDRSERIRTYNFPQSRVTDHRINLTLHNLGDFLSGDAFEELNENLRIRDQEIKLANLKQ
jgi:peptide chain release factor 1